MQHAVKVDGNNVKLEVMLYRNNYLAYKDEI